MAIPNAGLSTEKSAEHDVDIGTKRKNRYINLIKYNPREMLVTLLTLSVTTILGLSLAFLGIVLVFDRYNIDIESEIVFVALVPIIIALLIMGKIAIKEIHTPSGLKLLLEPLSGSSGSSVTSLEAIKNIQQDDEIIDISNYISPEHKDMTLSGEERGNLKKYIQNKNTKTLSFQLGQTYATDLIQACMEAIADDNERTIKYISFTNNVGEFEGALKICNAFHNRLLSAALRPNQSEDWTKLVDDIRSREVLDYPGTVTNGISAEKTSEDALKTMAEKGYSWLPIINEKNRFAGVISENKIVREVLLALVEEREE